MTQMYDSTTAADIPTTAMIVGGYIDGFYAWTVEDWARFPSAVQVDIIVDPSHDDGDVYDCETGNGIPADAPLWVAKRRNSGHSYPVVYCNLSTWQAVKDAFVNASVTPPGYWIAEWTGQPHMIPGADAVQYADPTTSGGHYDLSEVYSGPWLDAVTPPVAPAQPQPRELSMTTPYMAGDDVRAVQAHVGAGVDGIYGPQTAAAVQRWQTAHGLTPDGIVGPLTWHSLETNPPYTPPPALAFPGTISYGVGLPPEPPSPLVAQWQNAMTAHGYYCLADGQCGPATVAEIKNVQQAHDLTVDGIAGPLTWQALVS